MQCPKCNTEMQLRSGKFGEFYFCPAQYKGCTQKTITKPKAKKSRPVTYSPAPSCSTGYSEWERKRTLKHLDCTDYNMYGESINRDDDGCGEPCDDSGFWDNSDDWYRPY